MPASLSEDATSSIAIGAGDGLTIGGAATLSGAVTGAGTLGIAGGGTLTLGGNLAFGGVFAEAAGGMLALGANTLTLSGTGSSLAGSVGGTGTLALAGGTTSITGNVGFSGTFSEGAVNLAVATGDTFTLTGASSFAVGAVVDGAGMLSVSHATLGGLTVGGTATFNDTGTVVQTGAITLGDATSAAAKLAIASGATWTIAGNVGIAIGHSKSSAITVGGTLIKTAGTGVAKISAKITDSGLIEDAAGTLNLAGAVSGKGAMKIDAGATLELANNAAKTLTVTFNGAGATLDLAKPAKIAATIAGFTSGQTIDLLKTAATGVSLNGSDQLVVVDGTTTVATLQLTGNYAGRTFTLGSDGKGGSTITVSGPGAHPPPALFAQAMAGVGNGGGEGSEASRGMAHPTSTMRLLAPPVHWGR